MSRVTRSSRFKFSDLFSAFRLFTVSFTKLDLDTPPLSNLEAKLGFLPILVASKRSNPAEGRKISTAQYFTKNLIALRLNSFFTRWLGFLRFRRTRTRIRLSSSESSSEIEIDILLVLFCIETSNNNNCADRVCEEDTE